MRPFGRLRHFLRNEDGSIAVEGMLMLPILIWCYLGVFVFFDAFRAQGTNVKAAYTIGDALSRETGYVTPSYMDGLFTLHQFLVQSPADVRLRVSVFRFQASDNSYRVVWSQVRGGGSALTNATLAVLRPQLPIIPDGEKLILTETWVDYEPVYEVGLDDFTFENLVVTDIRFASQLCWNSVNNGTQATATC
jgi:hypothetical protein